jgi:molecular chaperone DnaK
MSANINFGIDLGTTNSLVAKFNNGQVEIFKNPVGFKETLPSVVAFRNNRILVGDKAREYIEKDPHNVFSSFKRKMGTSESFFVTSIADFKTPVQLSALVLNELKNFIYTGEKPESVVITIPASFDTIQSNATKKAGYEAGFKEVVLLQEPIAASLAFANKNYGTQLEGRWLVYDLGGGTFDVALVKIQDDEMKVVDHEGDNYLGGLDFDNAIIDGIILPYLQQKGIYETLCAELRSAKSSYNKLYYLLLLKAEEVKIALSAAMQADMEFETVDDNGNEQELFITVTREQLNEVVKEKIEYSVELVKKVLERNNVGKEDLNQVILIGGSTYIPLVKEMLAAALSIPVNAAVDPTTAVAAGAAYYAGAKPALVIASAPADEGTSGTTAGEPAIEVRMAYAKTSRETEEYLTALITGIQPGSFYRITRNDGGYDSGLKPAAERISEMLVLQPNQVNTFTFKLYDAQSNILSTSSSVITITQGKFSIEGQPLPNDICIEVDDTNNNATKLELIFEKNAILPLKKKIIKTLTKTITRAGNESLLINILEGSRYSMPTSCMTIGVIEINGKKLEHDLIKGSDIEITLEMSESRDLQVTAVTLMNEQEFGEVFNPSERHINISKLKNEVSGILYLAREELKELETGEQFESAALTMRHITELEEMEKQLKKLRDDDVSDIKYQVEEKKRRISAAMDGREKNSALALVKENYFTEKEECLYWLNQSGSPSLKAKFEKAIQKETDFLNAGSSFVLKNKIDELRQLSWEVKKKDPGVLLGAFHYYSSQPPGDFKDARQAKKYMEGGEKAIERKNYDELYVMLMQLYILHPDSDRRQSPFSGTGIG